jgi:hypothetical protein
VGGPVSLGEHGFIAFEAAVEGYAGFELEGGVAASRYTGLIGAGGDPDLGDVCAGAAEGIL